MYFSQETEEINNVLRSAGVAVDAYSDFHFGQFVQYPNHRGYFKRDKYWYTYDVDERNFCLFSGPYGKRGVIYACAFLLYITDKLKDYKFTSEEDKIFMHNHFRSFKEIDAYVSELGKTNS